MSNSYLFPSSLKLPENTEFTHVVEYAAEQVGVDFESKF